MTTLSLTIRVPVQSVAQVTGFMPELHKLWESRVKEEDPAKLLDLSLDGSLSLVVENLGRRNVLAKPVATYSRDPAPGLVAQFDALIKEALVAPGVGRVLQQTGKGDWKITVSLGEKVAEGPRFGAMLSELGQTVTVVSE